MFKLSSMYIPKLWVWKVKKKGKNMEYTHFDKHGNAVMVDVSEKAVTKRVAVAKGSIRMSRECFDIIKYLNLQIQNLLQRISHFTITKEPKKHPGLHLRND